MAKKAATIVNGLKYSFDAGNGNCKGVSTATPGVIQFAPVVTLKTDRRGLNEEDERPTISLKERDDKIYVFGVDDVFKHGKRTAIRRLNSGERYLSEDYFRFLHVLFLQSFSAYRGNSDYISPTGVISVPIKQYNDDDVTGEIRATLIGKRTLEDNEGCTLRLDIDGKRLTIIPESAGAMAHYAFDPATLRKRPENQTAGTTLVIDIGYETTDVSLFEGMAYQRDQGFTIPHAGMGLVARAIQEHARTELRDADASRIDRGMRLIAGTKTGAPKKIEVAPGIWLDVGELYDSEIDLLAHLIADEVRTQFSGSVVRAILTGGGAYHLKDALSDRLPFDPVICPDPDTANVLGGLTLLKLKEQSAG